MNKIRFSIWLFAVLLLSGCVKDELFHTAHPAQGAVKVTTTWSACSSEASLPASYILRIGSEEQTVTGYTNTFSTLFQPGEQSLQVFNKPDDMIVDGVTATVCTLADGTLNPTPGYLFAASDTLSIQADDTLSVTEPMKQYTRTLVLYLDLSEGDERRIAGTAATLGGIASAVNLVSGQLTLSSPQTIHPDFVLSSSSVTRGSASAHPVLTTSVRMLGFIPGVESLLNIDVTFTNGTTQTITANMTDAVKDFNNGDTSPLVLDATLTLPTEGDVSAAITDWMVVDNGDVNIH